MNADAIVKKVADWFVGQTVSVNGPYHRKNLTFNVDRFIPSETYEQFDGLYLRFYFKNIHDDKARIRSTLFVDRDFFDAIESTDTKFFRCVNNSSALLGYRFSLEFADLNNECLANI